VEADGVSERRADSRGRKVHGVGEAPRSRRVVRVDHRCHGVTVGVSGEQGRPALVRPFSGAGDHDIQNGRPPLGGQVKLVTGSVVH
jgi:hypothetical protein